jgi:threonine aldolase
MKIIDMRSDTVTLPTEEMRMAMCQAEVGDDVYEDDPTMKELEKLGAKLLGKEAAVFVPSGTFGNQLALLTHCLRGDEVILEENCHIIEHEVGASAVIAGVQLRTVKSKKGAMNPEDVRKVIREDDIHFPKTGLICMENAHSCGAVLPLNNMKEIYKIAGEHNIPVHVDGARIFNAAISLGVDVKEVSQYGDSIMFCLSKGLAAPVGSLLVGNREFIDRARKNRKLMGGGMRQAGILAAAGIVALNKMVGRLSEDHENAKLFADEISKIDTIKVKRDRLDINMVYFEIEGSKVESPELVEALKQKGIKINGIDKNEYRFVTNKDVTREDVLYVAEVLKDIVK